MNLSVYLSGSIITQSGFIPSDFKTRYFECVSLAGYSPGQENLQRILNSFQYLYYWL